MGMDYMQTSNKKNNEIDTGNKKGKLQRNGFT